MAEDEKNIEFSKEKNKSTATAAVKKQKQHSKKSFLWWAGVAVLILISITFVLPATGISSLFQKDSIVFGTYDGKDIEYKYGSYLYNQVNSIASQYGSNLDMSSLYQIWYQAYYSSVLHTALTEKAEAAGIKAVDKTINDYILNAGYYNDENGAFSSETYNSTDQTTKDLVYNAAAESVPATIVATDIASIISSKGEQDYVASLAAEGTAFEYVAFDSAIYPDEDAIAYANSNPQPFTTIGLSMISFATEEEANAALAEINAGTKTFEEAAASSIDAYASANGNVGEMMYSELNSIVYDEENLNKVFSTAAGSYTEALATAYGYSVFRVDTTPAVADFSNEEVLAKVKDYISANNADIITAYAETKANEFSTKAAESDFMTAAEELGYSTVEVTSTPANPASSAMLSSFAYTDAYGLLSSASTDTAYLSSLYTSDKGTVLPPQKAGNGYIVTEVGETATSSSMLSSMPAIYNYMASMNAQSDLSQSIMASSKFEDNFYSALFSEVLGTTTTN